MKEDEATSLVKPQSALEDIVKYYLIEGNGLDNTSAKIAVHLTIEAILQFVCWSGAPVYATPAADFADGNQVRTPIYIMDTCATALAVLYVTTKAFIESVRNKIHPSKLKPYMDTLNRTESILKYSSIIIGSLLTAIPLWLTAIEFPITSITILDDLFKAIVLLDNWLLHMFPINLMFEDKNPLYRLPLLPFMGIYKAHQWMKHRKMTSYHQQKRRLEIQQFKQYNFLKNNFITTISRTEQAIINNSFKFNRQSLLYKVNIPSQFTSLDSSESSVNQLIKLIEHTQSGSSSPNQQQSKVIGWCDWLLENTFSFLGGALAVISLLGYTADPLKEIPDIEPFSAAPDWVGQMVTWSSVYVFNLLFYYLSANITVDLYRYIKSLIAQDDTNKLPLIFKLYPKTFTVFMLINTLLAPFAGAAANELIKENFSEEVWDPYRPYLIKISAFGLAYLGFFSIKDAGKELFTMFGNLFGNSDTKGAIRLMKKLSQLKIAVGSMKGELFVNSLEKLPSGKKLLLLNGMTEEDYNQAAFFKVNNESSLLINTQKELIAKDDSEEEETTVFDK